MRVTFIRPLEHKKIPSTEEGTPKFLMYPMSWGIARPTCLLGSSGPHRSLRPTIRQKKMKRRRRKKAKKKRKKLPFTNA